MNSKISISYDAIMRSLFFLVLLLLPFQDSGLSATPLRMFGLYLSNLPLVVMVAFSFFHSIYIHRIEKKDIFIMLAFYYIIFYSLGLSFIIGDNVVISLYKTMTNCIILLFQIIVFFYAIRYFDVIRKYIWIVFLIDIAGCLVCDIAGIDLGILIHRPRSILADNRFHGFSSETSWFSYTTVLLGLLAAACSKSAIYKYIYIITALVVAFSGGSKGTILCIPLAFFIYVLFSGRYRIWTKALLVIVSSVILYEVYIEFVEESFIFDLRESTSFATRASSIISAVLIFFHYPLGTGFGSFTTIFRDYVIQGFDILNQLVPLYVISPNEILSMMNDPAGVGLTIKVVFFQYLAFFGIPFLYLLYRVIKYLVKEFQGSKKIYIITLYFIFISLATFAQIYYDSIITIAALYCLNKKDFSSESERIHVK